MYSYKAYIFLLWNMSKKMHQFAKTINNFFPHYPLDDGPCIWKDLPFYSREHISDNNNDTNDVNVTDYNFSVWVYLFGLWKSVDFSCQSTHIIILRFKKKSYLYQSNTRWDMYLNLCSLIGFTSSIHTWFMRKMHLLTAWFPLIMVYSK